MLIKKVTDRLMVPDKLILNDFDENLTGNRKRAELDFKKVNKDLKKFAKSTEFKTIIKIIRLINAKQSITKENNGIYSLIFLYNAFIKIPPY